MPYPRRALAILEKLLSKRHGRSTAGARHRHGMCDSNTAALCKLNGKDTIQTLSGKAWQGNGMGTACYVWINLYSTVSVCHPIPSSAANSFFFNLKLSVFNPSYLSSTASWMYVGSLTLNIPRGVLWGPPLVCYWLTSVEINKHKIFDTNNAWITEL